MQKLSLHSDCIYQFQSTQLLAQSVLTDIRDRISQDQIYWTDTGRSGSQSGRYGYVIDGLQRSIYHHQQLYEWCVDCINTAAAELFKNLVFDICDAWVTRSHFGQASGIHSHEWSMLSAIYYPHDFANDCGGEILFWPENPLKQKLMPFVSPENFKTPAPVKLQPQQGMLLVFPSYLQHSINQVKKMGAVRYSVAMNAVPSGVVSATDTGRLRISVLR